MYNVMIVEDEEVIRKGVSRGINWESLGFKICLEAENGKVAMDKIPVLRPDVVLTDVRMPIVDGLELAKWINKNFPEIKILILSGFADFEYAKSAIKFRVYEYLLKPTNLDKFKKTFHNLKNILDNESKEKDRLRSDQLKIKAGLMKLRNEFINDLLKEYNVEFQTLADRLNYLEIDFSAPNYTAAIIKINADLKKYKLEWENDYGILREKYHSVVSEVLQDVNGGQLAVVDLSQINMIFNIKKAGKEDETIKRLLEKIIFNIKKLIFNDDDLTICAGVGLTYPSITLLAKSYRQAEAAIDNFFLAKEEKVLFFESFKDEESDNERSWLKNYPSSIEEIIALTLTGQMEKLASLIEKLFESYKNKKVNPGFIKKYTNYMIFLLSTNLSEIESSEALKFIPEDYENTVKNSFTIQDLKNLIMKIFMDTARKVEKISSANKVAGRHAIEKVKLYIKENFDEDITLEDLAGIVSLSPAYISLLFKNVTGENYSEYLKKIRMKKAQELLKKTDLKVYEIAYEVGFNEYKYFAVQFKKMFGMTPGEVRDMK